MRSPLPDARLRVLLKMRRTGKKVINRDLYAGFKERVEFAEEIK